MTTSASRTGCQFVWQPAVNAHDGLRAVGVKAGSPVGPRVARCLDAGEHKAGIGDRWLVVSAAIAGRSDNHFAGALARVKAPLRSVGAARP